MERLRKLQLAKVLYDIAVIIIGFFTDRKESK